MKTLPIKFHKNDYDYTQLLRGQRSCVYEQRDPETSMVYYEVFVIKTKQESRIGDKVFESKEWFPPNEAWGYWAWTFRNKTAAEWRFNEIEQGKKRLEFTDPGTTDRIYSE